MAAFAHTVKNEKQRKCFMHSVHDASRPDDVDMMASKQQPDLLTPRECDEYLRFPRGRSARLARRGLMDAVTLPDGSLRFRRAELQRLIDGAPDQADPNLAGDQRQIVVRGGRQIETAARGLGGRESR